MAVTKVWSSGKITSTSYIVDIARTGATAGNTLAIVVADYFNSLGTFSASLVGVSGSAFTSAITSPLIGGGGGVQNGILYLTNCPGGSFTIQVTGTNEQAYFSLEAFELAGVNATSPLLYSVASPVKTLSASTTTIPLTLTTVAGALVLTGITSAYGPSVSYTQPAGYTLEYSDTSYAVANAAVASISATGTSQDATWSVTSGGANSAGVVGAVFAPASSGVSASAAQTNGTDTQSASAMLGVGSHAAQTNGTDIQAASGTPLIVANATQTNGTDTQAASGTPIIVANAAQTNGTDSQSASAVLGIKVYTVQINGTDIQVATAGGATTIGITAAQINGTDVQLASTNFNYNTLNSAYLYAAQQAATPLFYTMSPPAQASTAVYTASGTFTVPSYANYFLVSATAAGGSPYGSAGRQTSRQSLPVVAGDALTVSISPNVTVKRGTQTLLSLLDGAAYAKGTQGGLPQASGIVGLGSGVDQGVPLPAALVFIWN